MFRSITMTAVAALLAGPAFADGVSYARLSYDFTQYSNDDFDFELNSNLLQGSVEYEVGQFLLSADIANQVFSVNDDDLELSDLSYALSGAYVVSPEVLIGAGLLGSNFEVEGDFEEDTNGFEIFGQYVTGQFGAALNITKDDVDEDNVTSTFYGEFAATPEVTLAVVVATQSEFDGTDYILSAEYEAGQIDARAAFSDSSEDDMGVLMLRGDYKVTEQFRGSASLEILTGDDLPDAYTISVGAGYQIVDGLWADAKYAILDGDDVEGDADAIQIALTYELGDRKRLDRRLDQNLFDDRQVSSLPALELQF